MPALSAFAILSRMDGLETDTQLVNALADWAKLPPSRLAEEAGVAVTTMTRPANGKAKTRMGRVTLDKLRARWPDFPGWGPLPETNAIPFKMEGAPAGRMYDDIPVFGTALGSSKVYDGEAIEQTMLNTSEVVTYLKRPVILNGRTDIYGVFIAGSSMSPRHEEGETVYIDPKIPARPGDDILVYIRPNGEEDDGDRAACVLIKRLVRTTASYLELRQYDPDKVFKIERERVLKTHRVMRWSELIS